MTDNEFSCLVYWQKRYREREPQMKFRANTYDEFQEWKSGFSAKFAECLGKMPDEPTPLATRVLEETETERYVRRKILYRADPYSSIPAYLFIPKGVSFPRPAILCPHGHGRGKDDTAGIARNDADRAQLSKYNYNYAEQFAEHGFVTLAPDLRCFGERVDDPNEVYGHMDIEEGDHWCDINFVLGMLMGYNLLTLHVYDIGRGIELLEGLPEVASDRIGCVGLSQGGTTTMFSAAFHDKIKVVGISGYLNSWKVFPLTTGQICGSQIVPGLLEYGDHPEVVGLICPRPLFIESGISDPIFPIEGSRDSLQRVKEIYRVAGVPERLEAEEFEGVHEFRGNRIFGFFKEWL